MRGARVTKAKEKTVSESQEWPTVLLLLLRYLRSKRWKPCVFIIYHSHGGQVAAGFSWSLLLFNLGVCEVDAGDAVLPKLLFPASEP